MKLSNGSNEYPFVALQTLSRKGKDGYILRLSEWTTLPYDTVNYLKKSTKKYLAQPYSSSSYFECLRNLDYHSI